jgi:hypothetical protein
LAEYFFLKDLFSAQFLLFNARCAGSSSKKNKKDNKKNSDDPARSLLTGTHEVPGKRLVASLFRSIHHNVPNVFIGIGTAFRDGRGDIEICRSESPSGVRMQINLLENRLGLIGCPGCVLTLQKKNIQ